MSNMESNKGYTIKVDFEEKPQTELPLVAHIFDKAGNLLETRPIKGNQFTSPESLQRKQVFIAPAELTRYESVSVENLEKLGAYQPSLKGFDAKKKIFELPKIPSSLVLIWPWCLCRVRGKVSKLFPFPFFPITFPVCHARVHICNLEPLFFRLPDSVIWDIRDRLIDFELKPFPIPEPIPEPFPFPPIPRPEPINPVARMAMPVMRSMAMMNKSQTVTIQPEMIKELRSAASANQARLVLDSYVTAGHVLPFCITHLLYRCVELDVVETDSNGIFDTTLFLRCSQKKNLYFWVEYLIDGVWQAVYKPSYCGNTYWNYICNTFVNIRVTDSRVPIGCRPTQTSSFFEVVSIGAGAVVSNISQKVVNNPVTLTKDAPTDATGLIDMGYGGQSPFGKALSIWANSGLGFPSADATHYRCLYKKSSDADVAASWKSVNSGSYFRYYKEEVQITPTNTQAFTKGFELKDSIGADFYKLTHEDVENDLGAPVAPVINREWATDTYPIATLDTSTLENTHYDIRIEIYKKNTATNTFTLTTVAKNVFKVPNPSNPAATMDAPDTFLTKVTQGTITSHAFEMTIRVDNNGCNASIDNASVLVGTEIRTSDTACGMVNYGLDKNVGLTVGFNAQHPNNFARFSFDVTKGNSGSILSTSGHITDTPVAPNFTNTDSPTHNHHFVSSGLTVAAFLGDCNAAAFAENLYVAALATNGSNRLNEYDDSSTAAFAMIP